MIDRRGIGFILLVVILSLSVSFTPVRAGDGVGFRNKPMADADPLPGDSARPAVQALCSGDAGNLLYPLNASTIGDWSLAIQPCDDCSSESIPLGFTFNFYGDTYGDAFVNNNGNISFNAGLVTFWPNGFPDNRFVNLAPFYADVDTRENPEPGIPSDVYYRRLVDGNGDGTPDTFVATWRNVGHHERGFERRNTFQVAISDGSNLAMGLGNNVCFSYDTMCWTTGNFDGGVGGFGSVPAVVGANRGDGVHSFYIGRFNHDGIDYAGPAGEPGGVHFLDQKQLCFSTATTNGNICPIALDRAGEPVRIEPGHLFERTLHFVSPESNQVTSLSLADPSNAQGAGLAVTSSSGNPASLGLSWTPTCAAVGSYALVVHASDDAETPCTTDRSLQLEVSCDDGDPCTADACDPQQGCTHVPKSCDDGNVCTDDSCDPAGGCVHVPNSASCDDGQGCTGGDHCQNGQCVGGTGSGGCDDGNPCTDDTCSASGCVHVANRASCDDGNACTTRDQCRNSRCVGDGRKSCSDGDACTRDTCDPIQGCMHVTRDDDHDGVCNRRDVCEGSNLTPTVVVGTCDSHVPNTFFPFGCSISDFLDLCEERHGCSRSNRAHCVDHTLDRLRRFGIINRDQRRAIEHCYRP